MIDARNIYRKVTRKIYDFSPEQEKNLLAIVWLYRGETDRFLELLSDYLWYVVDEGKDCFKHEDEDGDTVSPLPEYVEALTDLWKAMEPFIGALPREGPHAETLAEFEKEQKLFAQDVKQFKDTVARAEDQWEKTPNTATGLNKLVNQFAPLADTSRSLIKQTDLLYKLASHLVEALQQVPSPRPSPSGRGSNIVGMLRNQLKRLDESRVQGIEQLKLVRYFWRQANWLTERFPGAELRDVEGLVKLVDRAEIEANDWSLTPGRYVGVAPEEEDENFDFEETLREIHVELEDLNAEAVTLAATIKKNFEELGI